MVVMRPVIVPRVVGGVVRPVIVPPRGRRAPRDRAPRGRRATRDRAPRGRGPYHGSLCHPSLFPVVDTIGSDDSGPSTAENDGNCSDFKRLSLRGVCAAAISTP